MKWTEWVGVVNNIIISAAAIIALLQYKLYKKSNIADKKRAIREKTINLMKEWEDNVDLQQSAAETLISALNEVECRFIVKQKKLSVSLDLKELAEAALHTKVSISEAETLDLSKENSIQLKFLVVKYLNYLEIVLSSWHAGLIDNKIVEQEFQFLYDQQSGYETLSSFRVAMGGTKTYPIIEKFILRLKEITKNAFPKAKPPV